MCKRNSLTGDGGILFNHMDWSKLKENKCPKCGSPLQADGLLTSFYACKNDLCSFNISSRRFDEIIKNMCSPKPRRCITFEANMGDLNNFGLEEMTEDFSDSSYYKNG